MLAQQIEAVLTTINDPEMPISIVDLGIVDSVDARDGEVRVRLLPTFVGCPALDMLRDEIVHKTSRLPGVTRVHVEFAFDPPWTPDRISAAGRADLQRFGVTVPKRGAGASEQLVQLGGIERVACPYCGAADAKLESPFGPTRCRMIYYCPACKNQFEHMKRVSASPSL